MARRIEPQATSHTGLPRFAFVAQGGFSCVNRVGIRPIPVDEHDIHCSIHGRPEVIGHPLEPRRRAGLQCDRIGWGPSRIPFDRLAPHSAFRRRLNIVDRGLSGSQSAGFLIQHLQFCLKRCHFLPEFHPAIEGFPERGVHPIGHILDVFHQHRLRRAANPSVLPQ